MIGGTGPESTISYYRTVVHGVQETAGEQTLPPITIESLSVFAAIIERLSAAISMMRRSALSAGTSRLSGAGSPSNT